MLGEHDKAEGPDDAENLRTTHWSIVLAAGHPPSPQAHAALTTLCQTYWKPVCAFIYQHGGDLENAKDLTQSFFLRLIESPDFLQAADPRRGRFRTFLLTAVRNFATNVHEWEQAQKRGGGLTFVPLDGVATDQAWIEEPADHMTPEKAFDRRWALSLLEQAAARLQREFVETGKGGQFEVMQEFLPGGRGGEASYAEAARQLGSSEAAVRQAAHRMRCRYRHLLRTEVAQTVGTLAQVEDELGYLLQALGA